LMNSHFLAGMGCGDFALLEQVSRERVRGFFDGLDRFRPALDGVRGRMDGTPDVVRVIEHRLAHPAADELSAAAEPNAARSPA
ncbi:MAG: hypothetical protein ACK52C_02010, partial [Planctomycetia bacterium]